MTDLRKAAEMALEVMEYNRANGTPNMGAAIEALRQALSNEFNPDWNQVEALQESLREHMAEIQRLRQALAMEKFSEVNQEIEEALKQLEQGNSNPNYPNSAFNTSFVDAVNMSQERVDETAKREHEPFIYVREDNEKPFGGYEHCSEADAGAFPVYTAPPISDYHEGWEEGFKAAKREWVGLTEYQRIKFADGMHIPLEAVEKIEAKLKEKNT